MKPIDIAGLVPITEYKKSVKEKINTWDMTPPPSLPDEANFETFANFYTVASCGDVSSEALNTIMDITPTLMANGFKLRHMGDDRDVLSNVSYNETPKLKQVFKPGKNFGTKESDDFLVLSRPTYDAHAIAAAAYNMEAVELKLQPFSGISEKKRNITEGTMSNSEKIAAIAALYSEEKNIKSEFRTFDLLEPSRRSMNAVKSHLLFGTDCIEPVKFVIISTPDDAKLVREVGANQSSIISETSKYLRMIIAMCQYFDLALYNINSEADRAALKKRVSELPKQV